MRTQAYTQALDTFYMDHNTFLASNLDEAVAFPQKCPILGSESNSEEVGKAANTG